MKAVCVVFDYGKANHYQRLAKVLEKSWKANARIPLELLSIPAPKTGERHIGLYSNTRKLEVWIEQFDQDTIFVDADMLCLRCPSVGFDMVDDIGITGRSGPLPINGGAMFIKKTGKGNAFMNDLKAVNQRMLSDISFHKRWQDKYAGINQSAIGYLIETQYQDYDLLPEKFNLCDDWSEWRTAYLIHIKDSLRKLCLRSRINYRMKPQQEIIKLWREYEDR